MQVHKIKFVLLLVAGVSSSFLLVPGKQERALMFMQDRQFKQAENLYKELQDENNAIRNNLIPLTRIYQGRGDMLPLIRMYEVYLKQNPDDIEVWERLSKLYHEVQMPYDQIEALERIVKKQPSLDRYSELVSLYDATGIKDQRLLTALTELIRLDPQREADTRDLILLQAATGRLAEAGKNMDAYVARFSENMDDELAELRLRLLLLSERIKDAFDWSQQWLQKQPSASLRHLALLYSGGLNSNLDLALDKQATVDPAKMPAWLVSAVMNVGWESDKLKFLERFVSRLGENIVRQYPVIMARLALKKGDKKSLEKWFAMAKAKQDLTVRQQFQLMTLYFMSARPSAGLALLSALVEKADIPASLWLQSLPLILKSGRIEEGLAVFQLLRERRKEHSINEAWALLAATAGKTQAVTKWLEAEADRKLSRRMLIDMYYAAADRSDYKLAAVVGKRLYSEYKGADEVRLLVGALLGIKQASAEINKQIVALLGVRLRTETLSREERRALAFQLLQVGAKQEAAEEFLQLAEAEGPDGQNLQQLLYIWGPMPGEKALDWLQARSRKSPTGQLAGWWQHLLQAGGSERVAAMTSSYIGVDIPAEAEDVLVHALTLTGGGDALALQLQTQAKKTDASIRLEQLAVIAGSAGLAETAEAIWQRLLDLQPMNTKAMKALGIAAFNRGEMPKAETLLSQVLRLSAADWESSFYLGEVFLADARQSEARSSFAKSLHFIETDSDTSKRKRIARAYLLYRLGKIDESMNRYETLIAAYPEDLDLRADYSAMLIAEGRLELASHLLERQR
ncbi:MAG: hypothetical protein OEY11_10080 [Gammaproteobacteria bacterium]|nr:hypothetical protein [Gammaproteobacteria bacterium]